MSAPSSTLRTSFVAERTRFMFSAVGSIEVHDWMNSRVRSTG